MRKSIQKSAKTTICSNGTCVTLFGPAAQFVALVTVVAVLAMAISLVSKVAK